jgi:hypothetical protein
VVEYKLPKLGVASSNLVARSTKGRLFIIKVRGSWNVFNFVQYHGYSAGLSRHLHRDLRGRQECMGIFELKFETDAGLNEGNVFYRPRLLSLYFGNARVVWI